MKKFIELINKDMNGEERADKNTVILRVYVCIICSHLLTQGISLLCMKQWMPGIISLIFCIVHGSFFFLSYLTSLSVSRTAYTIASIIWIIMSVYFVGWDCGAQHFLFVLLVFWVVTGYESMRVKLRCGFLFCVVRLLLYAYTQLHDPIYVLGRADLHCQQLVNTFWVFSGLLFLIVTFSKESILMEQKLLRYSEKMRRMATHDPLTDLYNRRRMLEVLEGYVKKYSEETAGFVVAIGDIDFFKKINDNYSHEAGDFVLKELASVMIEEVSKNHGVVARWGGEEFLFAFQNVNGDDVFLYLDGLRKKVEHHKFIYNEQEIPVTMTLGVEEFSETAGLDETVSKADQKLYLGKTQGRNRVVY